MYASLKKLSLESSNKNTDNKLNITRSNPSVRGEIITIIIIMRIFVKRHKVVISEALAAVGCVC